jgi:hypothetical protein
MKPKKEIRVGLPPFCHKCNSFHSRLESCKMQRTLVPLQPKYVMDRHLKAQETLVKLAQHPAIADHSVLDLMYIDIAQVCRNGHEKPFKKDCIEVQYTPENYKKYKAEFDAEFKEYSPEELKREKLLIRAEVPYEKVYGYSWKADHIEYWGEISILIFVGKNLDLWHDSKKWQRFSGVSATGRTFEEMITNLGKKFFKIHGKYIDEDFLTTAEKKNHRKEQPFLFIPVKHERLKASRMVHNPKFKTIFGSEINRRWVKWFAKTAYAKERFGSLRATLSGK